jgi:hypothetical protein
VSPRDAELQSSERETRTVRLLDGQVNTSPSADPYERTSTLTLHWQVVVTFKLKVPVS